MSKGAADRIVRGTVVTWIKLGIAILAQIITTPFYLEYWSSETYGAWLAVLTVVSLLQIPGTSFQNYIGFEMMREFAQNRRKFSIIINSSVRLGGVYGLFELCIAFFLSITVLPIILGKDAPAELCRQGASALFFNALGSGLVYNWGGMWVRGVSAVGHFSRWAWWGVVDGLVKAGAPLLVLPLGWGMDKVSIFLSIILIVLHQLTLWDVRKVVKRYMDADASPNWPLAWRSLATSQVLSIRSALEMFRQQGIRLILAPLLGMKELAAFATMRAGANAALQGLSTLTTPLMPELMRFLAKRDQERSEAAMATVWLAVVCVMAPVIVIMQLFVVELFTWWTRGKVSFNPLLFAIISSSILIFSNAQPATSIVRGNNLVRAQLINSIYSSSALVVLTFLLVPHVGLVGAGIALLCAEIVSTIGFRITALNWLNHNGLRWPSKSGNLANISIIINIITVLLIACLPEIKWFIFVMYLPISIVAIICYWRSLPKVAILRAGELLLKLPFIGLKLGRKWNSKKRTVS